ncbi:MAG: FkbM family methyltransferase [Pseudomonadota bacterium]
MLLQKVYGKCHHLYEKYIERDPNRLAFHEWVRIKGDQTLLKDYPLTAESIVVDVGGYLGDWTESIFKKYQPNCFVFEPMDAYFQKMVERFKTNPKIRTFNFGLSNADTSADLFIQGAGSSVYSAANEKPEVSTTTIQLRDITRVFQELDIKFVDLITINIEGGEFDLFERMIESGLTKQCKNIQVQFHSYIDDAEEKRAKIHKKLSLTHIKSYDYPFTWESWRLKSPVS